MSVKLPPSIVKIRDAWIYDNVCGAPDIFDASIKAWDACYSHMIARACVGFDEDKASVESEIFTDYDNAAYAFMCGAHWQHDQTAMHSQDLLDTLEQVHETNFILEAEIGQLEGKLNWLVKHSIDTTSISKARGAEILGVPLIDMDTHLNKIREGEEMGNENPKLRTWSQLKEARFKKNLDEAFEYLHASLEAATEDIRSVSESLDLSIEKLAKKSKEKGSK